MDEEKELNEETVPPESQSCEAPTEGDVEASEEESKEAALPSESEKLQIEISELKDKFLRKCADLDNYKKRVEKEKHDLLNYANEDIIRELLSVMDNFGRALAHAEETDTNAGTGALNSLKDGIKHTISNMLSTLKRFGLEEIPAVGTPFDPKVHESIGHEASTEYAPGTIAKELQRGYMLKKRLLRPSLVLIAAEAENAASKKQAQDGKEESMEEKPTLCEGSED